VPGSSAFAGEFLILSGSYQRAWWWAVLGATGIVLAAMYMLRLISAVLHQSPGPRVVPEALDLRPAELGVVVPLVGLLLALSVWPAGISQHSFAGNAAQAVSQQFRAAAGTTPGASAAACPETAAGADVAHLRAMGCP
jgi:NADH-quinone oxidoreductase subunit M